MAPITMYDILHGLVRDCHAQLDTSDEDPFGGNAYLRGRGVTKDQIKEFRVGLGIPQVRVREVDEDAKKFNRQFRGKLAGQLTFPIYNSLGVLRGMETRLWEETETRKYTQFWLSTWKEDAVFLGLPQALPHIWETRVVYLAEGVFDFFPLQRVFPNTLCPLRATVMATQHRFLRRHCRHVVFCYDRDKKGREVQEEMQERYNVEDSGGFDVHQLAYPAKDPSELYQKWGFPKFERYLRAQSERLTLYL